MAFTHSTYKPTKARLLDSGANAYNKGKLFTGNGLSFDGVNDDVVVGNIAQTCKTVSFYVKATTTTEKIVDFDTATHVAELVSGTVTATGFSSPTIYVDGVSGSIAFAGVWHHIVITTATGFNVSNLVFAHSGATFSDIDLANVKIFDLELSAANVLELFQNPEQILPTGVGAANLVGWWLLAENNAATFSFDGSQNKNHGTITGCTVINEISKPVIQHSLKSNSELLYFDGVTDNLVNLGDIDIFSGDFSASFWVFSNNFSGQIALFNKGIIICWTSNLKIDFGISTGFIRTDSALVSNKINHIVVSHDISLTEFLRYKVYINGVLIISTPILTYSQPVDNNNVLYLGQRDNRTSKLTGFIRDFALWDSVLTISEISELFNKTKSPLNIQNVNLQGYWKNKGNKNSDWLDEKNNNDGIISSSATQFSLYEGINNGKDLFSFNLNNINTGELIFNGNGYAEIPDDSTLDISTAITIEAWIKLSKLGVAQAIISKESVYSLQITTANKPEFSFWQTTEKAAATTTTTLAVDTWYHLAATYDNASTNVLIYVDGVLDTTVGTYSGNIDTNNNSVYIGKLDAAGSEKFNGYIDEVKIYNSALTAAQILENRDAQSSTHSNA